MLITPKGWDISDSSRDAQRYKRLLSALDYAIREIRAMEMKESIGGTNALLDRLLPVMAETLNAEDAFAALLREGEDRERYLEITAAYPRGDLRGCRLEYMERVQKLIGDGVRQIIDPYWEKQPDIIPGLEVFDATSAILVRMESADETRIVGVCNKRNPESEVFLAADGMSLDIIVELVALGTRVGERRRRELETIQKTSAAISSYLDLQEVLGTIVDSIIQVTGCQKSAIFLVDQERNELNLEMAQGLSKEYVLGSRSLKVDPETRAAVIFDGSPIEVTDIEAELRFAFYKELAHQEGFHAFIDVPMKIKEETIGAITAYYAQPHDFSKEEVDLLTTLANQAAIAVHNARQYEALRQTQMDLASAITVAWLGIPGAVWSHDVNQKTSAICYNADTLRDLINPQDKVSQDILDDIERAAREIQDIPMKGPLPAKTGEPVKPIAVAEVLEKWLPRWCRGRTDVKLNLQLRCENAFARIDDQWLAVALQKLIGNALKAMPDGGSLTVASMVVNDTLEIRLEDTGYGVPKKALPYFLKQYVPPTVRRDRSGSGMGALMAKFILRSYGGDLKLLWTEEGKGTALSILLPVAQNAL